MSAVIKTIMDWAIPNLGVGNIIAIALPTNTASIRVFEKNGFTHYNTIMDYKPLSESRGGGMYSIYVVEWKRPKSISNFK